MRAAAARNNMSSVSHRCSYGVNLATFAEIMYQIVVHFQFPTDPTMKAFWQPNMMSGSSDPVFQAAMKRYFDMADDDKNGTTTAL